VSADDIIDHHMRMMEYLMKILLPAHAKRQGVEVPDKVINILDMTGLGQELTLVHFSAQRKRFLWDRGFI